MRKSEEVSAVAKMYDFTLWLLPHIAKFSRDHRFTLGDRMEVGALEILGEMPQRCSILAISAHRLRRANNRRESLRYLVRLAKDLQLLNIKQ